MSIAFLESLLYQSEQSLNANNAILGKSVATNIVSSVNLSSDIKIPSDTINNIKESRDKLKVVYKEFTKLLEDSNYGSSLDKKLATSEQIDKIKAKAIATLKSIPNDSALNLNTTVIAEAIKYINDCKTLGSFSTTISKAKDFNIKKALNYALPDEVAKALLDTLDNKLKQTLEALADLIKATTTKSKGQSKEELTNKFIMKITGVDLGSKESNALVASVVDSAKDYASSVPLIVNRVTTKFAITEEEKRKVVESAAQILDLTSLEKVWAEDLRIVSKADIWTRNEKKILAENLSDRATLDKDISTFCTNLIRKMSEECKRKSDGYSGGLSGKVSEGVWIWTNISTEALKYSETYNTEDVLLKALYSYNSAQQYATFNNTLAITISEKMPKNSWSNPSRRPWAIIKDITRKANAWVTGPNSAEVSAGTSEQFKRLLTLVASDGNFFDPGHINSVELSAVGGHTARRVLSGLKDTNPLNRSSILKAMEAMSEDLKSEKDLAGRFKGIFNSALSSDLQAKLAQEYITGEIELTRILTDTNVLAQLERAYRVVSDEREGQTEFTQVFQKLIDIGQQVTGVRLEQSMLNRWFGPSLQKYMKDAKIAYTNGLILKLKKHVEAYKSDNSIGLKVGGVTYDSILELEGSPSLKTLMEKRILNKLKGISTPAAEKLVSKVKSKKNYAKTSTLAKVSSNLSISKPIGSASITSSSKLSKIQVTKPKITSGPQKVEGKSSVTKSPRKKPTVSRLRNTQGSFTSITHIRNLLDLNLFNTLKKNMTAPRLVFRSGRFASSAQIQSITHGKDDVLDIRYTYMKNPYQTFEPGFKQGSLARDPKTLITGSIREILKDKVLQRLRVTRV